MYGPKPVALVSGYRNGGAPPALLAQTGGEVQWEWKVGPHGQPGGPGPTPRPWVDAPIGMASATGSPSAV
jgi:hypothetical protein